MGEWLIFIEAIFAMWMECREKRDAERLRKRVHRRGPFAAMFIRRGLVRIGLEGKALQDACDEYWDAFDMMSKAEVDLTIDEAEGRYVASAAASAPAPE